jgi:hypothetical protein
VPQTLRAKLAEALEAALSNDNPHRFVTDDVVDAALRSVNELHAELERQVKELKDEVVEQCRINAMGAEREFALMGKIEALEKENAALFHDSGFGKKVIADIVAAVGGEDAK